MIARCRAALLLVLTVSAMLALPDAAHADAGPTGGDLQVAQTLGERELTVLVRRVAAGPGPVRIEIVTHTGTPPAILGLRLSPAGAGRPVDGRPPAGTVVSSGRIPFGAVPGLYGTTLEVDRPGPWELAIDDGARTARIPFTVPTPRIPAWEAAAYGGFATAGALMLVAIALAARARRAWVAMVPAGGAVAAVAVAATAALLSAQLPAADGRLDPTVDDVSAAGASPVGDGSRPPVNVSLHAGPAGAGRPVELRLTLTDGSTGRPVDDLLVQHGALMHLILIAPSGELRHLHPIRVAPGDYRATFTPPLAGTYAVAVELARRGGGVQLVRPPGGLTVAEVAVPASEPRAPDAGAYVQLSSVSDGAATTITVRVGDRPDLQLWLGMTGHLIVVGPVARESDQVGVDALAAPIWAHAHAMAPMNPGQQPPDETVAAFGPDVRFTYTFPMPGHYRLWIQVQRDYTTLTIPAALDVPVRDGRWP